MNFLHQRSARIKLRYLALILAVGALMGVTVFVLHSSNLHSSSPTQSLAQISCSEKPSFEQTTLWLTTCLSMNASAEDVARMLVAWGRIGHVPNSDWGGVSSAHLFPDGNSQLVIRYYPESVVLKNEYWDPQGKLMIVQHDAQHWRVAFDASTLRIKRADGTDESLAWQYNLLAAGDVTGDKLDDLLMELYHSNGTHFTLRYVLVLTAHPNHDRAELHAAFLQKANPVRPYDLYRFVDIAGTPTLQSTARLDSGDQIAITRTFSFEGDSFTLAQQVIDPKLCRSAATAPDGSLWCTFEGPYDTEPYVAPAGLYRVKDGQVSHFPMTALIHSLKVVTDGTLYVAVGRGILRYRLGQWETLASLDGDELKHALYTTDMAFADNGDVWAAGTFSLARFDGKSWTEYSINARRVLVAPDNSVWTEGWNGVANSDCCFTHLIGNTWVTYTHSARLPVSGELLKDIQALQR